MKIRLCVSAALLLSGCASNPTAVSPQVVTEDSAARAGIEDDAVGQLVARHWDHLMVENPTWATQLGDHRYDDRVQDVSEAAFERRRSATAGFLTEARELEKKTLSATDETTLRLFTEMLQHSVDSDVCRFETWTLSARGNPVTEWNEVVESHPVNNAQDAKNLVRRVELAGAQIDNAADNLRRGAAAGLYANAESVRRVQEMVGGQLAMAVDEWAMLKPAKKGVAEWPEFEPAMKSAIETSLRPALARYKKTLDEVIAPHARGAEQTGLGALPFGTKCYEARIRNFTGLPLTAKEIHETGVQEIARINAEMITLGEKLFSTSSLPEILEHLRTDSTIFFASEEEIVAKAEGALKKAREALPKYFGLLPKADCVVQTIPDYEAPFTTIAYYKQPVPDGSKPGEYFINVYKPETRPKYEMEALSYHESIPGHHVQIAIAQERPQMPSFRKHLGQTAFVEGWALYTEQLADEMGLYSGDLDRMGMLSYEAWRAARLVVDTGLHAMGWSRDRAKKYMHDHTALAVNNIDNEVDRYIVWPGQALGYKTGQLEIWKLRRDAENTLGERFDLKGFHDAVLSGGAVSLPVLRQQIAQWVKSRATN